MWQQLKCIHYPTLLLVLLVFSTERWPTIPLALSCVWIWNPMSQALQPSDARDHVLSEPMYRCQIPGSPCSGAKVSLCFCRSFSLTLHHVGPVAIVRFYWWLTAMSECQVPTCCDGKNWGDGKEGPLTPLYPLGSKHTSSVRTLYTVS